MSSSPPPPTHEVLSKPSSYTRTRLRGGHAIDHEESRVSLWVRGSWTLQGRLVVRVAP